MPVRSMQSGNAHELHQLVAQRDPFGQVHAHKTLGVLAQPVYAHCLGGRGCVL